MLYGLFVHAVTVIDDLKKDILAGDDSPLTQETVFQQFNITGRYADLSSLGHSVGAVEHQVHHNLFYLGQVRFDGIIFCIQL